MANDRTQIQTFAAGSSGALVRVEVRIMKGSAAVDDLDISLWSTNQLGLPGALLSAHSVSASLIAPNFSFVTWDLGAQAVAVSTGDLLAIMLNTKAPNTPPFFNERYDWAIGGQYLGGVAHTGFGTNYFEQAEDFHFRTYMAAAIPEPETYALMLAGLAALALARRQQRR